MLPPLHTHILTHRLILVSLADCMNISSVQLSELSSAFSIDFTTRGALALSLWDIIINLGGGVRDVWSSPCGAARTLFFFVRYGGLASLLYAGHAVYMSRIQIYLTWSTVSLILARMIIRLRSRRGLLDEPLLSSRKQIGRMALVFQVPVIIPANEVYI
ncbi:hypothetical protein BDY19DRAFT_776791 [Irpex rosettiformis]|uniref:Uncharacterized protein n=1 Tax=Irpex rosettiformis TaxID=378272 RepID=A0ACB8TM68_9APHY|nr:hypothetical protein BDY19DRAFT_776791 [Irpex rosettiformis]